MDCLLDIARKAVELLTLCLGLVVGGALFGFAIVAFQAMATQ